MRGLGRFVGKRVKIVTDNNDDRYASVAVVTEGILKENFSGFMIISIYDGSIRYFSSRFLKYLPNKWRGNYYSHSFPGVILRVKDDFDSSKPPSIGGFEKRIRIKQLAKLK